MLLSINPNAISLLEQNPDKINWIFLSKNPNAISLLEQNPDKIYWNRLSENISAIHLLEKNQDKINWNFISINPSIFIDEYQIGAKQYFKKFITEELMAYVWHPRRMSVWPEQNDLDF